tara:strand:+ start:896 stop:1102 length:207 start_codon:yes stop_codon:yes gene_type:complete
MQVPYWIGFDVVFRRLIMRLERLRTAALLLLALSLPPWLYYVPVALSDEYWYSSGLHMMRAASWLHLG